MIERVRILRLRWSVVHGADRNRDRGETAVGIAVVGLDRETVAAVEVGIGRVDEIGAVPLRLPSAGPVTTT